jgi:hypothetical protein
MHAYEDFLDPDHLDKVGLARLLTLETWQRSAVSNFFNVHGPLCSPPQAGEGGKAIQQAVAKRLPNMPVITGETAAANNVRVQTWRSISCRFVVTPPECIQTLSSSAPLPPQGGSFGITNRYVDGFWYLDQLGSLASLGMNMGKHASWWAVI